MVPRNALVVFVMIVSQSVFAQIEDFQWFNGEYYGYTYLDLSVAGMTAYNNSAPHPELHKHSNISADLQLVNPTSGLYETRLYYRNKIIHDLIPEAASLFEDGTGDNLSGSVITNLFGNMTMYYNVFVHDRFILSGGLMGGDYLVGTVYEVIEESGVATTLYVQPSGEHIVLGPAVNVDVSITSYLLLTASTEYSFSLAAIPVHNSSTNISPYPSPNFLYTSINLVSRWGLFIGYERLQILDAGLYDVSTVRHDYKFGVRFHF